MKAMEGGGGSDLPVFHSRVTQCSAEWRRLCLRTKTWLLEGWPFKCCSSSEAGALLMALYIRFTTICTCFARLALRRSLKPQKEMGLLLLLKLRCHRIRAPPQFIQDTLNKTVFKWARCRLSKTPTCLLLFHASCYKDTRLIFNSKA